MLRQHLGSQSPSWLAILDAIVEEEAPYLNLRVLCRGVVDAILMASTEAPLPERSKPYTLFILYALSSGSLFEAERRMMLEDLDAYFDQDDIGGALQLDREEVEDVYAHFSSRARKRRRGST